MLVLGVASSHAPTTLLPVEEWPAVYERLVGDVPQPLAAAAETAETNLIARRRIDEGFAANAVSRDSKEIQQSLSEATAKSAGEQGKLAQMAKDALAAPGAKQAVATGDVLYGYGDYAKAAELYRAALGKSGVDTNLTNLHLGMALARAGDKAGATAALNKVEGPKAALAKYWLAWLASRP